MTTADGQVHPADYVVLAMGSQPNFFNTPGAVEHALPLYTLDDARAVRTRLLSILESADRRPELLAQGALNIVIIGAGPTGVESAGALSDIVHNLVPMAYRDLPPGAVQITVVDLGHSLLGAFSDKAHEYGQGAAERRRGPQAGRGGVGDHCRPGAFQ